jgi:hypothetical protein
MSWAPEGQIGQMKMKGILYKVTQMSDLAHGPDLVYNYSGMRYLS